MTLPRHILATATLWLLGLGLTACVTTPLPIPPTADPERIGISDSMNGPPEVSVTGGPGAVDPGSEDSNRLRITRVGEPIDGAPPFTEIEIAPDGSFEAVLTGYSSDLFYIELVTDDDDLYLITLQGGMDGPVQSVDPGPDRDGDGSPDAIDCAPDDDSVGGRRCG